MPREMLSRLWWSWARAEALDLSTALRCQAGVASCMGVKGVSQVTGLSTDISLDICESSGFNVGKLTFSKCPAYPRGKQLEVWTTIFTASPIIGYRYPITPECYHPV